MGNAPPQIPIVSNKFKEIGTLEDGVKVARDFTAIVAAMRSKAHVKTFDQAAGQCSKGHRGIRGVVLNHEDDAMAIWVTAKDGSGSFWAPASAFSPVGR